MKRTHYTIIFLLPLLLIGCRIKSEEKTWVAIKQGIRSAYPDVQRISTSELHAWLKDTGRPKPLLLDTRSPEEYQVSHLPGARLASDTDFNSISKDQPIVTYCSVGARSAARARQLKQQGFTRVANLEGSIFQWFNEGRPVVRDGQPVFEVHPYDKNWGRLLKPKE